MMAGSTRVMLSVLGAISQPVLAEDTDSNIGLQIQIKFSSGMQAMDF